MADESTKEKVGALALDIWKDFAPTIPDIIKEIAGPTEVILQGKHKEESEKILRKMEEDLAAFKNKEIDRIELTDLVQRRKAAIYALYNANKIANQKPSIQKVLDAAEKIAATILIKAIPIIIGAVL